MICAGKPDCAREWCDEGSELSAGVKGGSGGGDMAALHVECVVTVRSAMRVDHGLPSRYPPAVWLCSMELIIDVKSVFS